MKYQVYGIVTATKFLGEFEAVSEADAIAMGLDSEANRVSLCHQCSGEFSLDENCCNDGFAEEA